MGADGAIAMQKGFVKAIEDFNKLNIGEFTDEMHKWDAALQASYHVSITTFANLPSECVRRGF